EWIRRQPGKKLVTKTQLFIVPGYRFQIVRGLITNFHQPHSTLLLLVAALVGPAWKSVYSWALEHNYRFLSYGDGCLFLP
ncbi:MAG TPA: S-adenosylmethionine tRNA ribosyltransferase, partial [Chitinophagaceae bacterium]|nr:S-adenosylmethionine tRNA ribosyltransferase [Chitinophagaceae bacterium]